MGRKRRRDYFTKDTELAIIEYNETDDPELKAKIFKERIYFSFYKLTENVFNNYRERFPYIEIDHIDELIQEVISLLLEEKIAGFDPDLGFKAFSYFQTIIKRYLIGKNDKEYKIKKKLDYYDENDEYYTESYSIDPHEIKNPNAITLSEFVDIYIEEVYENLEELFPRKSDLKIADAILQLFERRKELDMFKKKALYIYIREMTGVDTIHLTRVIRVLKQLFYSKYNKLLENDMIALN